MSSRFTPNSESRYVPPRDRDRSPPPRFDRRGSMNYGSGPGARNSDNSYRPGDFSSSGPRDLPRDPPRGPKAAQEGGHGGSFAPRGRGHHGRGDRDSNFRRRESDRGDWARRDTFDPRDRRASPGQNRSRSPLRDLRGGARELDTNRVPRTGGPPSAESANSDGTATSGPPYGRGGFRGRGRGAWDRGRGRDGDDKDPFQRSRSRDRGWDQGIRDSRARDFDRDPLLREDDRRSDGGGDNDRSRRDPPTRPDSRNSTASLGAGPSQTLQSAYPSFGPINPERFRENFKSAAAPDLAGRQDPRGNGDFRPYSLARAARSIVPQIPSSPPQPTQVPAFGSIASRIPPPTLSAMDQSGSPGTETLSTGPAKLDIADPIMSAPKAPKAELNQPPSGPKGGTPFQRRGLAAISPGRPFETHDMQPGASPQMARFGGPPKGPAAGSPSASGPGQGRSFPQWCAPYLASKAHHNDPLPTTSNPSPSDPAGRFSRGDGTPSPSSGPFSGTSVRIPTGPKASQPSIRAPMAPRNFPGGNKSATWVNPALLREQRPSILSPMSPTTPIRRVQTAGDDRARRLRAKSVENAPASSHLKPGPKPSILGDRNAKMKAVVAEEVKMDMASTDADAPKQAVEERIAAAVEGMDIQAEESTSQEEEDAVDLDQEDFDDAERQYQKDIDNINAKRPASPKHHPEILQLLDEVDALDIALEHLRQGKPIPLTEKDETPARTGPLGLPSPASEAEKEEPPVEDVKYEEASVSAELSLDGLPYLASGIPTPLSQVSDEDVLLESHDAFQTLVIRTLADATEREVDEEARLRKLYAERYGPWRDKIEATELAKREAEEQTRETTPFPPPLPEPVATTPGSEKTRQRNHTTQYELEQAIAASKAEAEAEAQKRAEREREMLERQRNSIPDMTKEACIPNMLTETEQKDSMFLDTNNLVETRLVLETFNFVPPEDDFDEEEQRLFIAGYMATPKKFGHIALGIPGRDYQDCIQHYYLTKTDTVYKHLLNRKGPVQKAAKTLRAQGNRKTRAARDGAKSLNSVGGTDGTTDLLPVPVTETGRPKRSAAPKFDGDKDKKAAEGTTAKTPARRGPNATKSTGEPGDGSVEKPAPRRGRQAQPKEKAKRGPKAATAASAPAPASAPVPAPVPSPPKLEVSAGPAVPDIRMDAAMPREPEGAYMQVQPSRELEIPGLPPKPRPPPKTMFGGGVAPQEFPAGWAEVYRKQMREWNENRERLLEEQTPGIPPKPPAPLSRARFGTLLPDISDEGYQRELARWKEVRDRMVQQYVMQMMGQPMGQPVGPPVPAHMPGPAAALPPAAAHEPPVAVTEPSQSLLPVQAPSGALVPTSVAPVKRESRNASGSVGRSYWSVQEQDDFVTCLKHCGTDWMRISQYLGTKTHTMVTHSKLATLACLSSVR